MGSKKPQSITSATAPPLSLIDEYGETNGHMTSAMLPPKAKKPKQAVEQIYQKKTQLEHILLRPDTYIGSVEPVTEQMWVVEDEKMVLRGITYVPGLYKIFDEILVNAADNKQRDTNMDTVKINIDPENSSISIFNNGSGIPVQMHKDEKMYVPTMIFGHLLTSSNFNDEEKKVTGGRNGYGAKLCNVFSKEFTVETACRENRKCFKQTWKSNMTKSSDPKIKDYSGDDFTKITFIPDLSKFKMDSLDNDIVALFRRRAYDIAGTTAGVKVFLNGKRLPVKGFKDYVDLVLGDKVDESGASVKYHYEKVNDRWEIAVAPSDNNFQQISFVNSIATTKGGRHIDYLSEMITKQLVEGINKKNKGGIQVKPFQIKNHLWIFANCLIENPTFDSQTKENMTLQSKSFGSKCTPSDAFWTKVSKSGIIESVLQWAKFKQDNLLNKAAGGKKTNKLKGIPKLEDANDAGTKNSMDCTLILTEGDSAKTLAVAGLGVVGRDKYGVFPLRGKLLNVREASHKQIIENAEITALVKIIGLQYKKKYLTPSDMSTLRYGKLMIMTDQDHDGSHIKGLIINFIHHNWPSLLQMKFLEEFITPIVKVTKGTSVTSFFSLPELEEWKKSNSNWKTWKIKYYKGLGTSTSKEAKEYFENIERHRIKFHYSGPVDDEQINMAFSKKCVDLRKDWLTNWMDGCKRRKEFGLSEEVIYSSNVRQITYADFVNKELVLFSNLDNERSIPCLVDGFKPGQRKVLFTCFKRNDKREVKVAQLGGSVAEHSAYHHGEQSLMSTIINLAQNFVGSNNINLLMPNGQFGTRLQGGKDCSAPRYIHTQLSPLARLIFDPRDDPLLTNLFDDNKKIEPEWYIPIIPMVLVNGADGIGTGWMTKVPNYNPREIVNNLRKLINGEEPTHMKPWYKNFRGDIIEISPIKYCLNGEIGIINDNTIEITELPVGTWTQNYKESVLEPMMTGSEKIQALINNYKEYNTDSTVKFILELKPGTMEKFEKEGYHKSLKLQSVVNLTSMVLFDQNGCLKRYDSELEILSEFFILRLDFYSRRREYLVGLLSAESSKLSNQARFVVEKCEGSLVVENKKKKSMVDELIRRKYESDPLKEWRNRQMQSLREQEEENEEEEENEQVEVVISGRDFDYLLGMPIYSLTLERKEELLKKRDEKMRELELIKKKSPANLYLDDLDKFIRELDRVEKEEEEDDKKSNLISLAGSSGSSKGGHKKGQQSSSKVNNKKKLYELQTCPSPIAERVRPKIDNLIAKLDKEEMKRSKVGVKKETKVKQEKAVKVVMKDEFDLMAEDNESFKEKVNESMEVEGDGDFGMEIDREDFDFGESNGDVKVKVVAKKQVAKKGANVGPKSKTISSGNGGSFKQTKLNFKPAAANDDKEKASKSKVKAKPAAKSTKSKSKSSSSPKKKKKKEYDFLSSSEEDEDDNDIFSSTSEEEEEVKVDKKEKKKEKVVVVESDGDSEEDADFRPAVKTKRGESDKKKKKVNYVVDDESESEDEDDDFRPAAKKTVKKGTTAATTAAAAEKKKRRAISSSSSSSEDSDY